MLRCPHDDFAQVVNLGLHDDQIVKIIGSGSGSHQGIGVVSIQIIPGRVGQNRAGLIVGHVVNQGVEFNDDIFPNGVVGGVRYIAEAEKHRTGAVICIGIAGRGAGNIFIRQGHAAAAVGCEIDGTDRVRAPRHIAAGNGWHIFRRRQTIGVRSKVAIGTDKRDARRIIVEELHTRRQVIFDNHVRRSPLGHLGGDAVPDDFSGHRQRANRLNTINIHLESTCGIISTDINPDNIGKIQPGSRTGGINTVGGQQTHGGLGKVDSDRGRADRVAPNGPVCIDQPNPKGAGIARQAPRHDTHRGISGQVNDTVGVAQISAATAGG